MPNDTITDTARNNTVNGAATDVITTTTEKKSSWLKYTLWGVGALTVVGVGAFFLFGGKGAAAVAETVIETVPA